LYYKSRELQDIHVKNLIYKTLKEDGYLGSKRMSDHLKLFSNITINHKKIARIKKKYDIRVQYHRPNPHKRDRKLPDVSTLGITNLVKDLLPQSPNHIWSSDFTYLSFHGKWYYLATLKDNFTKEIVGWKLGKNHDVNLITSAYLLATKVFDYLKFLHSDQGSEYRCASYLTLCRSSGIEISMSAKGKPTENGYQESYYNYFKLELGNINRFKTTAELFQRIGRQIYRYNHFRIHSVIRTTPALFRKNYNKKAVSVDNNPVMALGKEASLRSGIYLKADLKKGVQSAILGVVSGLYQPHINFPFLVKTH
jgi:putative transposase